MNPGRSASLSDGEKRMGEQRDTKDLSAEKQSDTKDLSAEKFDTKVSFSSKSQMFWNASCC